MKTKMIKSIAGEIYRQNKLFQDQVVMKELNENGVLFDLYRDYKEKLFPRTDKKQFAAIYSQTVIFCNPPYSRHSLNKKYEVMGSDIVDTPLFKTTAGGDGRVYINENQYFSNISREMWEFEICGYQVLKKWLWYRKKRILTPGDIHYFIKICRAVQLTARYCDDIDILYAHLEETI